MKFSDQDSYAIWKCSTLQKIGNSVKTLHLLVQNTLIAFIVTILPLFQMTFYLSTDEEVTQVLAMIQAKLQRWTPQVSVKMHQDIFTS
jgi:hypothetical protein